MNVTVDIQITTPAGIQQRRVKAITSGWKLISKQPDGFLFYRTELSGSLTLGGADYSWLYQHWQTLTCCAEAEVALSRPDCNDAALLVPLWQGYFNLAAIKWNHGECSAVIDNIPPLDGYEYIFRNWEKPINLMEITTRFPLIAQYQDQLMWEPNEQGQLRQVLPDGNVVGTGSIRADHVYPRAVDFMGGLAHLLRETLRNTPTEIYNMTFVGVQSDFYTAPVNPVTKRKNYRKFLLAGSDAKRPASMEPAVRSITTLKEIFEDLRALHNVHFLLETETMGFPVVRLEHYSWFSRRTYSGAIGLPVIDLRKKNSKALASADNESTYFDDLYHKEELTISGNTESDKQEFRIGNITYDATCIAPDLSGKIKENNITATRIFTDLMVAYAHADTIEDTAILLLDCNMSDPITGVPYAFAHVTQRPGWFSSGVITIDLNFGSIFSLPSNNYYLLNGDQSAARLFADFHRHGRGFKTGTVNIVPTDLGPSGGTVMAMFSVKATRRQEGIQIQTCCADFPMNLSGPIRTNRFARGEIDKATLDLSSLLLTLDVRGESRCSGVVVTPADPGSDPGSGNCPMYGTFLATRLENGLSIGTFADGECGTYEVILFDSSTLYGG